MLRAVVKVSIPVLVCVLAMSAFAGEGRIPIWQPIVIDGTTYGAGKYIVTRNINVAAGAVINISVDDVDIDLNGFTLSTVGSPVIGANNARNVTVRNGTLRGGTRGIEIFFDNAADERYKALIEYVNVIESEQEGIYLLNMSDFAVRWNNVLRTGEEAIWAETTLGDQTQGTIEHNRIESCGGGIWVRGGSSVAILNNRVEDLSLVPSPAPPAQGAIVYDYSDAALIANNTVETIRSSVDPGEANGIYLGDASGCKIHNNVVRRVDDDGIDIAGFSDDNIIFENVVSQSARDGLRVEGSRNHIDRNVLNSNCQNGTATCWGLHFDPAWGGALNTFGRNTARGNLGSVPPCMTAGPYVATTDFCDEQPGSASFNDNYMPNFF